MSAPTSEASGQRLLSTVEAARYLGVSRSTVDRLRIVGEIAVISYFKYPRFDRVDLDGFIERIKSR